MQLPPSATPVFLRRSPKTSALLSCCAAAFLALAIPNAAAQVRSVAEKPDALQSGSVQGSLTNASTGDPVANALITVAGQSAAVRADSQGWFRVTGIAAGPCTLAVASPDIQPTRIVDVVVKPGETVSLGNIKVPPAFDVNKVQQLDEYSITANASLDDVVVMEKFTVSDYDKQIETSLRRARQADTYTNVITAEKMSTFPDRNTAEALQRISGLAVQRDGGEGRQIVIRGLNSEYNSTELDGIQIAGTEGSTRQISLSVLPTESIGSIEVTKVATPDLPGDAMGGNISIKTRSAFDSPNWKKGKPALSLFVQGRYSDYTDSIRGNKFGAVYGDVFATGRLGILIAGSYEYRFYTNDQIDMPVANGDGWKQVTDTVTGSPTRGQTFWGIGQNLKFRRHETDQKRTSVNANIEYKPKADATYYLRVLYASYTADENRYSTNVPFDGDSNVLRSITATSGEYTSRRAMLEYRYRPKKNDIATITTGGEWYFGAWKLSAQAGFSEGAENRDGTFETYFRHAARDQVWRYELGKEYYPVVSFVSGPSLDNASTFNELSRLRVTGFEARENNYAGNFDIGRSLHLSSTIEAVLKAGGMVRIKTKSNDEDTTNYNVGAPAGFTLSQFFDAKTDFPYMNTPRIDRTVRDWFWQNYSLFTPAPDVSASNTNDWEVDENVYAGYLMGSLHINRKLSIIAGVRYERTETESSGNQITGTIIKPVSQKGSYDNVMPGVHLRCEITPRIIARASWSNTVSRAPFNQIAFSRSYDDSISDSVITQGNPDLKALKSSGADASLEYYFNKHGMASLAGFYKGITDFTYRTTLAGQYDPLTDTVRPIRTYVNGPKAWVKGLELAYQQQLKFLPKPFDGFGLLANITLLRSEAGYPTRPGEKIPLIGQSDTVTNLGITYEKKWFYIRAAWNYRSPRINELRSLGDNADGDESYDDNQQLDLSCTIKLPKGFELYAEWLNATNESERYYQRGSKRFVREFFYGPTINLGVRWAL